MYGVPFGEKGTEGWLSLNEHIALTLIQMHTELGRLADGRRDLLRIRSGGEREDRLDCIGHALPGQPF
jgi:hypothetical protein